ncbi:MAG TPA: hypothetical protein VFR37_11860 [Longimicrobium sp.]|nr:hypothetical protein [Longimicrobium sp.]
MTFKEATDRAQALGLTADAIAAHLGVKAQTYRVMRLTGEHGRRPPADWQARLARAIEARREELARLRADVEREG